MFPSCRIQIGPVIQLLLLSYSHRTESASRIAPKSSRIFQRAINQLSHGIASPKVRRYIPLGPLVRRREEPRFIVLQELHEGGQIGSEPCAKWRGCKAMTYRSNVGLERVVGAWVVQLVLNGAQNCV